MLNIFIGKDEFSIEEAIGELKNLIDSPELIDANVTRLKTADTSPGELLAISSTVPFMASRRLVIVEGLIDSLSKTKEDKSRVVKGDTQASHWSTFVESVATLPNTTELVIIDEGNKRNNTWIQQLAAIGAVKRFDELSKRDLHQWITGRSSGKGLKISRGAVLLLSDMIGPNLRLMDSELEKLSLYANGELITEEEIVLMVSHVREMSIFEVVDSMLESRFDDALKALTNLHKDTSIGHVITMLARQIRLILIAKDLQSQNLKVQEIGDRIGINSKYVLDKVRFQSNRHSYDAMKYIHAGLVDLDQSIRMGKTKENLVDGYLVQIFKESLNTAGLD